MINGKSILLPMFGYPTEPFKAPYIYNPWFDNRNIDAVVVPMGIKPEDYAESLAAVFRMSNVHGALVTMPHKVRTVALMDNLSKTAQVAGSCNAILKRPDGSLLGDMFDGEGFVRGLKRNGFKCEGARCLLIGAGGVGSAIAASLAESGIAAVDVIKTRSQSADILVERLQTFFPQVRTRLVHNNDVKGFDLIVNGTPLGLPGDPLPFDLTNLSPSTFVGEVVMKQEMTPLLEIARERGCAYVLGTEMLFEMIPAYLEFFGFGTTTPDELRSLAKIAY